MLKRIKQNLVILRSSTATVRNNFQRRGIIVRISEHVILGTHKGKYMTILEILSLRRMDPLEVFPFSHEDVIDQQKLSLTIFFFFKGS